jgi:hypothetical protein
MNAKAGDNEEQEDADVTKRAGELDHAYRMLEEIVWKDLLTLLDGVIEDDT